MQTNRPDVTATYGQRLAVDVKEAAHLCGVSVPTIRRCVKDGSLRGRKIRDRLLFTTEDLRAFLAGEHVT